MESTCVAKAGLVGESVGEGTSVGTGISVGDEGALGIFERESVGEGASVGTGISVGDEGGTGISVESSGSSGWFHGVVHSHAGEVGEPHSGVCDSVTDGTFEVGGTALVSGIAVGEALKGEVSSVGAEEESLPNSTCSSWPIPPP